MKDSAMNSPTRDPKSKLPAEPPHNQLLPGMAAVSLWMLALAVLGVVGILTGHFATESSNIAALAFCTLFACAALGLMRRRRWGWALTLGAAFFSMCFAFYSLFRSHQSEWIVMGVVNLVFFLYLVRREVLERLE